MPAAMLTRRFMPPEKVDTRSLARSDRPTTSRAQATRSARSLRGMRYTPVKKRRFCSALSVG